MTIDASIDEYQQLTREFTEAVNKMSFPAHDRLRIGAALLDQSHEHSVAILVLLNHQCTGAAFALLRGQFESVLRGFWILRCASDGQLERFKEDQIDLHSREIIEDVEIALGEQSSVLSEIKRRSWPALSSFVHGGFHQAVRRISGDSITPVYTDKEKLSLIKFSRFLYLLAAVETCYVGGDEESAIYWAERYLGRD